MGESDLTYLLGVLLVLWLMVAVLIARDLPLMGASWPMPRPVGMEAYGAAADNKGLGKDQIQGLAGGWYQFNSRMAVTFALLGGSHVASPKIGGQVGFEVDLPLHRSLVKQQIASTSILRRTP